MSIKSMDLVWIVVKDLKKAIKFYTETVGLKLMVSEESFGWAELQGHSGGTRLGICQVQPDGEFKAGQNAVMTLTVEDVEKAKKRCRKKALR